MTKKFFCAGCMKDGMRESCPGSFLKRGISKVHWECWSSCNLPCTFCYRTRADALNTFDAHKLIQAVSSTGAKTLVFAGGDPSLRADLIELIEFARKQELRIEVQTNAQAISPALRTTLTSVDLVGLSIDGPDAPTHDLFRGTKGNFRRIIQLLDELEQAGTKVVVRSIVSKTNHQNIASIGSLLQRRPNVIRWSLLEFSPIGEGFASQDIYSLNRNIFEETVRRVLDTFPHPNKVDVYRQEAKVGTYALLTPSGELYGTTITPAMGIYPTIGSMLRHHLDDLAESLPFSKDNHNNRYDFDG